jgi:hypothetical protein
VQREPGLPEQLGDGLAVGLDDPSHLLVRAAQQLAQRKGLAVADRQAPVRLRDGQQGAGGRDIAGWILGQPGELAPGGSQPAQLGLAAHRNENGHGRPRRGLARARHAEAEVEHVRL